MSLRLAAALLLPFAAHALEPSAVPPAPNRGEASIDAPLALPSTIDPTEAEGLLHTAGLVVIDVRTQAEWDASGSIRGAILIPLAELAQRIGELPADLDAPLLVYCAGGGRALRAIETLAAWGFENVANLEGGYRAWVEAGLPTATGDDR